MPPQRKKILYVITKSNFGGAQKYVYDLVTNIPKDQFEAVVVFGGTGEKNAAQGFLDTKLKENAPEVKRIFLSSFMRDFSLFQEFKVLNNLKAVFIRERPDIIHLNSSKAGGIGALAGRIAGVKNIIFTVHGWPFLEDRSFIAKALIWILSWITVLLCHKVICISEFDLKIARKMPFVGNKAVRIYNGIAPLNLGAGEKIRSAFPTGVRITGMIGELTHNKNQIALIEKAKSNPDMYVALVGAGEDYNMLSAEIQKSGLQNRVKLFGFLPVEEVLKGFDVFALSSLKEGLPYVLLEARAAGLPIEANRIGGVGEILDATDMHEFTLEHMVKKTIEAYSRNSFAA